jgi:hypothetical protein
MEIRITKVKEKDGRVVIHFQKPTPGGNEGEGMKEQKKGEGDAT